MILSDEYKEIKELAAKFSDAEVAPLADEIDKKGEIPQSLKNKLAEMGFMGIFVPTKYGGAGMDYLSYAIIIEEISRNCASTGVYLSAHNSLAIWPILEYGSVEQKKTYLAKMCSGQWVGCFCLSEPDAGSDAAALTTRGDLRDNYYHLNGTKNWITNGKEADVAIVFAKTHRTKDYKGMSAFIVQSKQKGFNLIKIEDKLGIKGSSTAQIAIENLKLPIDALLGVDKKGFSIALSTLDGGRVGIAAQALGIAEGAFRYALRYAKQREQFGVSISSFQGLQFMLADMSTKIDATRALVYKASFMKDKQLPFSKEAAQAKLFAAETAMWVTTKAIQICGGVGYTKECPVERFFRDAKITEIYEGTSEIQRVVIAAYELKNI